MWASAIAVLVVSGPIAYSPAAGATAASPVVRTGTLDGLAASGTVYGLAAGTPVTEDWQGTGKYVLTEPTVGALPGQNEIDTLSWDETITATLGELAGPSQYDNPVVTHEDVSGGLTISIDASPQGPAQSCTGEYELADLQRTFSMYVSGPGVSASGTVPAQLQGGGAPPKYAFKPTSAINFPSCTANNGGFPPPNMTPSDNSAIGADLSPTFSLPFPLREGEYPRVFKFGPRVTVLSPKVDERYTASVDAKLTIVVGKGTVKPPVLPQPPYRKIGKLKALLYLRDALPQALYPCLMSSAALPLGTFGMGTMLKGGLPALMTGSVAGSYWGPICGSDIISIVDATQTADDPPLGGYTTVAVPHGVTVPNIRVDCRKYKASLQAYCHTLVADLANYLKAQYGAQSVTTALATTIGRETAAMKAGDSKAVRAQDGALKGLLAELARATRARSASGTAIAKAVSGEKVQMLVPSGWFPTALNQVLSKLAGKGVQARTVESLAPGDLVDRQVNELSELAAR